jgi:hypothetical protein
MSITLDELFELFEEVENSGILLERKQAKPDKSQLLNLFKLQISENWGKQDTVERQELSRIVQAATAGKKNVIERLNIIEKQMFELRQGTLGKIRNPRRILSQIILLETFNRLFKSFQAAPAGFINEGLLSVFYGGFQEEAGEANKAFQIGDVIAEDGTPISIKTKARGKAFVDGSIKNLYNSINGSPTKKVYFDVFIKDAKEGKNGSHVGTLTFMRFFVDSTNINSFLDRNLFIQDPKDPKKIRLRPEYERTFLNIPASNEEELEEARTKEESEKFFDAAGEQLKLLLSKNPEMSIEDVFKSLKIKIGKNNVSALLKVLDDKARENPELQKFDTELSRYYNKEFRGSKGARFSDKGNIETEFKLDEQNWMRFAKEQGTMVYNPVVINFSDNEIEQVITKAVEQIDESITGLFNSLATFTDSVQEYLTSIKSNRGMIGMKAIEEAKILPSKTDAVVQVAAGKEPEQMDMFKKEE